MATRRPANSNQVTFNMVKPRLCHSELARGLHIRIKAIKFWRVRTMEQDSWTLMYAGDAQLNTYGNFLEMCSVTPKITAVMCDVDHYKQKGQSRAHAQA